MKKRQRASQEALFYIKRELLIIYLSQELPAKREIALGSIT